MDSMNIDWMTFECRLHYFPWNLNFDENIVLPMLKYLTNYDFHELYFYITRTHVVFRVTDALVEANKVIKIETDEG